jgi:hypothetical protein
MWTIQATEAPAPQYASTDDIKWVHYLWAIPILVGIPGNVISIMVAVRPNNRNLSPCIYMAAMGVADTLFLFESALSLFADGIILRFGIIQNPLWYIRYVFTGFDTYKITFHAPPHTSIATLLTNLLSNSGFLAESRSIQVDDSTALDLHTYMYTRVF